MDRCLFDLNIHIHTFRRLHVSIHINVAFIFLATDCLISLMRVCLPGPVNRQPHINARCSPLGGPMLFIVYALVFSVYVELVLHFFVYRLRASMSKFHRPTYQAANDAIGLCDSILGWLL